MPKMIKTGVGMMEQTREQFDFTGENAEQEIEAFREIAEIAFTGPDETRDRVALGFMAILEESGLPDPGVMAINPEVYGQQGEASAQYIAAQWLLRYHRLGRVKKNVLNASNSSDLQLIIMHAEELGKLKERLFWRQGIDEQTGKRPEDLALAGRRQVKNGQQGNEMRTDNSFSVKHGKSAQNYVNDLYKRNPRLSWADLQRRAAKKFGVSAVTIKRNLTNPKKVGSSRCD